MLYQRAVLLNQLGRRNEAEVDLQEVLELASAGDQTDQQTRAQLMLGSQALSRNDLDEADQYTRSGLEFYREGNYRTEISQALSILGKIDNRRGNATAAVTRSAEAHTRAQVLGDPVLMIMTLLAQAEARLAAGQGEAALALAVEALDEAESREQWVQAWHAAVLARLASSDVGDAAGVTAYKTRQDELLNHLRAQWSGAAVDRYLRRPDIAVLLT